MNFSRNQIIIIAAAGGIILFFILVIIGVIPGLRSSNNGSGEGVTINIWGIEEENNMRPLIEAYNQIYQSVQINYLQLSEKNYESQLISSLAGGKGPDIFMIHNSWLPKYSEIISPINSEQLTLKSFSESFPSVVKQDFVLKQTPEESEKIYALPIYIDTLAFIYNKGIFDAKGIAIAPNNWTQFKYIIPRLTEVDPSNRIIKSAAAIGGSGKSIANASDLLNLIMMQFGSSIIDERDKPIFSHDEGLEAFNFYLSFSNPQNIYYTWSDNLRNSLDSFSQGQTAAIFDYSSAISIIKSKNPFLNIAIAPMLQMENIEATDKKNYPDYWGLAVSKQSKNNAWAWNFIVSSFGNPEIAEKYLEASKRPPALRSLITKYQADDNLGIFAAQALTAESWPQPDANESRKIFSDAIEAVLAGRLSPQKALEEAESKINSLK
ncbi:MAG: extracellular solute-binding protein [Patescibacteria group bacterium]